MLTLKGTILLPVEMESCLTCPEALKAIKYYSYVNRDLCLYFFGHFILKWLWVKNVSYAFDIY